jgi:hypothetical protein
MATLYDTAREGFLRGEIVWKVDGSVIKASLVRGYTFSTTHRYLSEVIGAGGVIVATETLSSLTNTLGVADAADAEWEGVPEGDPIPSVVIYQASAVTGGVDLPAAQQRLIAHVSRRVGGVALAIIPNGQLITGRWSPGSDRIFRF